MQSFEINGFHPAEMYPCAKEESGFKDDVSHLGIFTIFNISQENLLVGEQLKEKQLVVT